MSSQSDMLSVGSELRLNFKILMTEQSVVEQITGLRDDVVDRPQQYHGMTRVWPFF